jgi:hypothetical protein
MQHNSYESIDSFTVYLDGQGEHLRESLQGHFRSLEESLGTQSEVGHGIMHMHSLTLFILLKYTHTHLLSLFA